MTDLLPFPPTTKKCVVSGAEMAVGIPPWPNTLGEFEVGPIGVNIIRLPSGRNTERVVVFAAGLTLVNATRPCGKSANGPSCAAGGVESSDGLAFP